MSTVKEEVKALIDTLPDNATVEDIQYVLYVRERVERGKREIEDGDFVSQADAQQQMNQWRGK